MFFKSVVLSFIGVFCIFCSAQTHNQNLLYNRGFQANMQESIRNRTESLQCYVCNSEYDPRCGDPFNPYSIGYINCTDKETPEHLKDYLHLDRNVTPVVCRKMIQTVEGKTRVIRSCGYIKDDHDDKKCFRRTGTSQVEVIHCSCTKSLCNTGHVTLQPYYNLIYLVTAILLSTTSLLGNLS